VKVLSSHKFKNSDTGKELRVLYFNKSDQKRLNLPDKDVLAISRIDDGDERRTYIGTDEAVMMIWLLSEAVYRSTKAYEIGIR
jgi:hypothetical protein